MNRLKKSAVYSVLFASVAAIFATSVLAQSRDQGFPSPILSNEVSGIIRPRDIGDSRSTTYYYAFNGEQGDIFINVVTKNFEGSVDIFTIAGLNPLAKMVFYGDASQGETGRLIYLRKPERLLLRVEGRTPNDDPANYKIKFAGSFVALAADSSSASQPPPTISSAGEDTGIRVNSVGTIIEVIKKREPIKAVEPSKKEIAKDTAKSEKVSEPKNEITKTGSVPALINPVKGTAKIDSKKPAKSVKEVKPVASKKPLNVETPENGATGETATQKPPSEKKVETKTKAERSKERSTKPSEKETTPDPMANFRLVIELKDGTITWRPMTEVLKFGVDRGILTVINKNGNITRYQVVDVAKITMQ